MLSLDHPYTAWAVALGIGLLIGAERERRKGEGPSRSAAGIRTFTIAALLGAVSMDIGGSTLLSLTAAGLLGLIAIAYYRSQTDNPGLTTEMSLVMTLLLGGLAVQDPVKAAALGVTVAILLAARTPMHRFVREVLNASRAEICIDLCCGHTCRVARHPRSLSRSFRRDQSTLDLVHCHPDHGHQRVRLCSVARPGCPVRTACYRSCLRVCIEQRNHCCNGSKSARRPTSAGSRCRGRGALNGCYGRSGGPTGGSNNSRATLAALALPLICAGLAAVAYGLLFAIRLTELVPVSQAKTGDAFSFKAALLLAVTLAIILLATAALRSWLGEKGLVVAAGMAGFADAHATSVSVAAQVAAGKMAAEDACVPILVGFTTNSITKIALAVASGSKEFALRVVPGLILVLAAAWIGLLPRFV